jgi:hypothetical protein
MIRSKAREMNNQLENLEAIDNKEIVRLMRILYNDVLARINEPDKGFQGFHRFLDVEILDLLDTMGESTRYNLHQTLTKDVKYKSKLKTVGISLLTDLYISKNNETGEYTFINMLYSIETEQSGFTFNCRDLSQGNIWFENRFFYRDNKTPINIDTAMLNTRIQDLMTIKDIGEYMSKPFISEQALNCDTNSYEYIIHNYKAINTSKIKIKHNSKVVSGLIDTVKESLEKYGIFCGFIDYNTWLKSLYYLWILKLVPDDDCKKVHIGYDTHMVLNSLSSLGLNPYNNRVLCSGNLEIKVNEKQLKTIIDLLLNIVFNPMMNSYNIGLESVVEWGVISSHNCANPSYTNEYNENVKKLKLFLDRLL